MNQVKTFIRSFRRDFLLSSISLLGLTLGMFCFLITALFVRDELTHDQWHENADNIYMSTIKVEATGGVRINMIPSYLLTDAMVENSPYVLDAVNISNANKGNYSVNNQEFETKGIYWTQESFFNVFDFGLEIGNEASALSDPSGVVVSKEMANKHWPNQNPVGQSLRLKTDDLDQEFLITGVLKEIPSNSHMRFDFLLPINKDVEPYKSYSENWRTGVGLNYFLLDKGVTVEKLKEEVISVLSTHKEAYGSDEDFEEFTSGYNFARFSEMYMDGNTMRNDNANMFGGQRKYIYIFTIIGVLMLIVSCFNYVNLTMAKSIARVKSIVVRKIIGAGRANLILENMLETLFIATIALIVAVIGLEMMLPSINNMIGKSLEFSVFAEPDILIIPIGLLLLVTLVSGIYPAITISSMHLANLLHGSMPQNGRNLTRKFLVVLQFMVCSGLLSAALIIRGQTNYLINKDIGYNTESIVNLSLTDVGLYDKFEEVKTALETIPSINDMAGSPLPGLGFVFFVKETEDSPSMTLFYGYAEKNFNDLLKIELLQGEGFDNLDAAELENAILINEAAAEVLGFEDPIGKKLDNDMVIRGVLKDFHYWSARSKIGPAAIQYGKDNITNIQIRCKAGDLEKVKAQIEVALAPLNPTAAVELTPLENYFSSSFQKEERLVSIFDYLTAILVVVSFLGLFALATFENQLREKELGIRKVLGAKAFNLIVIMNSKFFYLIVIALVVSVPVSYWLISQWLADFSYRIDSLFQFYAVAILMVTLGSILSLSIQSYWKTKINPVEVLRNDN